ncbi:sulfatase-like hydrolase/transferase [Nocardioides sp. C4-1]|uniref:sulfatase-like hydrolase/transferase n=1 Tax=Nocardioides sp. C4-1 TaxID=3151851 RepID=UPI003262E8C0
MSRRSAGPMALLVVLGLLAAAPGWTSAGPLGSSGPAPAATPSETVSDAPTDAPTETPTSPSPAPGTVRNAIVFLVDDMSDFACRDTARFLPKSSAWLSARGTCFENAATATPVCCPARAQVQTGQLPHNNHVRTQFEAGRLDATDTVQHDLGEAGLRTYGIGKFLNGVKASRFYGLGALDNGFEDFDFWDSYRHAPGRFAMYDDDGSARFRATGLNSAETNGALLDAALDDYLATGERFFVYSAFFAPHKQGPGTSTDSLPLPSPANARRPVPPFRFAPEADTRDKLRLFRKLRAPRAYYQRLWNARIRSLYDVDDQMARTFRRLEDAGVLDQTAVVFASDNGYTDRGQVNWDGKAIPYPASTDVPMLAWFPGRPREVVQRGVQLVDIAPTLYDVLGVEPGHELDGRSLRSSVARRVFYGEFKQEENALVKNESGRRTGWVRSWRLLKRGPWSYVVWYHDDGRILARELYRDPQMLANLLWPGHRGARPPRGVVRSLHHELVRLSRCRGTAEQGAPNPCP